MQGFAIILTASACCTTTNADSNLIANSGFENSPTGVDWVRTGSSGFNSVPRSGTGNAWVNISTGSISQTISTTVGDTYLVECWVAYNGFSYSGTLTVSFGDTEGFSESIDYFKEVYNYEKVSFTAVATEALTTFDFSGTMQGGTFFMDDVSVTDISQPSVPEGCSSLALLSTSIAILGVVNRKRNKIVNQ